MVKTVLERDKCIGCGSCEAVCPQYWKMADDAKVNLLGSKDAGNNNYELEVNEAGCNQEAADVCPVQCIRIDK